MHPRTATSAVLLYLCASTSADLQLRNPDLAPRQANANSSSTSSTSNGEGGASGGGANPVIAAGSMGVTSSMTTSTSKAGAAPRATGEVNAKVWVVGAAGLVAGML